MKGSRMKNKIFETLRVEFGSLYRLSKVLGLTTNAVYQWETKGIVPMRHLKTIEQLTEGRVTRQFMRPDIFGDLL
jgi:DNA-binding transcriptional regulator YdaS (Cro superfamily)